MILFSNSHLWLRRILSDRHVYDIGVTKYLINYMGDITHLDFTADINNTIIKGCNTLH